MKNIGQYLYNFGLQLGHLYIEIFKVFVPKLAILHNGRLQTFQKLKSLDTKDKKTLWIHCASLGEFEQGRMLIEKVRIQSPETYILLSFFSPSGYEIIKNYDKVDEIIYLPTDFESNALKLVNIIKPTLVVFVKYEFWWNLIIELQNQKIPLYLIAGVFRKDNYFFRFPFNSFSRLLTKYEMLYIQNKTSASVLSSMGIENYQIVGDPRIDRAIHRSHSTVINDDLYEYCKGKSVIIYGSVWPSDMKILAKFINSNVDYVHIIAPHNVKKEHLTKITKFLTKNYDNYSDDILDKNILIIDNIGMLGGLYKIAKYAYIGGGFGVSIHNLLEPAVFGIPVIFGPNHTKFKEAYDLIDINAGFAVHNIEQFEKVITNFEHNPQQLEITKSALKEYFIQSEGATDTIYKGIKHLLK